MNHNQVETKHEMSFHDSMWHIQHPPPLAVNSQYSKYLNQIIIVTTTAQVTQTCYPFGYEIPVRNCSTSLAVAPETHAKQA